MGHGATFVWWQFTGSKRVIFSFYLSTDVRLENPLIPFLSLQYDLTGSRNWTTSFSVACLNDPLYYFSEKAV